MGRHFDLYRDLQLLGIKTVISNARNKNTAKLLQDYLTLIPDLTDLYSLDAMPGNSEIQVIMRENEL